jgi:hypothetical protein
LPFAIQLGVPRGFVGLSFGARLGGALLLLVTQGAVFGLLVLLLLVLGIGLTRLFLGTQTGGEQLLAQ